MRPGAPPKPTRYVYTGPGEVSSLITDTPGTPVIPCCKETYTSIIYRDEPVAKFYVYSDVSHTHTPCLRQSCLYAMRWRWGWMGEWRWAEGENDTKDYLTGTRGGERKRRGESKHPHQHTWPGAGKPWKGKGKEKRRPTDTEKDQRRGGKDGSAWTNLPQRNLRLPRHAQDPTYLGREERMK